MGEMASFFEVCDAARADDVAALAEAMATHEGEVDAATDRGAGNVLHFACDAAARRVVEHVLDEAPHLVNRGAAEDGSTPLHRIARHCHVTRTEPDGTTSEPYLELYAVLLRRGADPTIPDKEHGVLPHDCVVRRCEARPFLQRAGVALTVPNGKQNR